jgi:hypothetical protein
MFCSRFWPVLCNGKEREHKVRIHSAAGYRSIMLYMLLITESIG